MRPLIFAFAALCLAPAVGVAQDRLTPEEIVRFFSDSAGGAAESTGAGRTRSVHVGPTGFGPSDGSAAAQPGHDERALDLLVTFELDSARLTDAARANLDAFVQALEHPALAGSRFAVEGHTDATGPADHNLTLSERRAAAVRDYLTRKGVDPTKLVAHGFGEARPRAADPNAGENRRVETRRLP